MARPLIAVVGPGADASAVECRLAESLGGLFAEKGWVVVTGGLAVGVMDAACRGASRKGGLSLGILPGTDRSGASPYLSLALPTGLGQARNALLVTVCDAVTVCGMSAGTASEAALALRMAKPTVFVGTSPEVRVFFSTLSCERQPRFVATPEEAIQLLDTALGA
jgi:uncharacterized protein (TIGR00725 family)